MRSLFPRFVVDEDAAHDGHGDLPVEGTADQHRAKDRHIERCEQQPRNRMRAGCLLFESFPEQEEGNPKEDARREVHQLHAFHRIVSFAVVTNYIYTTLDEE